jgi:hypothetical protein
MKIDTFSNNNSASANNYSNKVNVTLSREEFIDEVHKYIIEQRKKRKNLQQNDNTITKK